MNLLAVERIKLFSTRAPWFCAIAAVVLTVGYGALYTANNLNHPDRLSVSDTTIGYQFGTAVVMVLAALAITTEYRFGTIRTTFQAVPNRTAALLGKVGVVALVALVLGEIGGFGAWGISYAMSSASGLALTTSQDWINVAGGGIYYAIAAVIAVSVGILLRHSAGAIGLLLIYSLIGEHLVEFVSKTAYHWLPMHVGENFLNYSAESGVSLSQGASLAYYAGFAVVLLLIALGVAKKRDA